MEIPPDGELMPDGELNPEDSVSADSISEVPNQSEESKTARSRRTPSVSRKSKKIDKKESAAPEPCISCGKDAELEVRQTFGPDIDIVRLCISCARELGIRMGESVLPMTVGDLYARVLDPEGSSTRDARICPACHTTFAEIRLSGTVGCVRCFDEFHRDIEQLLPRIADRTTHSGSVPKRLHPFKRLFVDKHDLKQRLDSALINEDYESAARLRDAIQEIDEGADV